MLSQDLHLLGVENMSSSGVESDMLFSICVSIFFWKHSELETFHGRLHHWFLNFFIRIDITRTKPPPLHPSMSSNLFMVTFITYSCVDIFMISSGVVSHSSCHKTQTIRQILFEQKKTYLSPNKAILHHTFINLASFHHMQR